jgi:hypothetical protein
LTRNEQFPVALLLAISLLITGFPIVASSGSADQRPALMLDICTPANLTGTTYNQCALPIPTPDAWSQRMPALGDVADAAPLTDESRLADSPDPPPPKTRSTIAA